VLFFHSYGGVPGCEALGEYVKDMEDNKEAREGKRKRENGWGKVRQLIFCAAFVLPKGGSLMAALGGKDLPWFRVDGDYVRPDTPERIFYNDLCVFCSPSPILTTPPRFLPNLIHVIAPLRWRPLKSPPSSITPTRHSAAS